MKQTTDINTTTNETNNEELIKTERFGSFIICEQDGEFWAALGNYRVTNNVNNKEQLKELIINFGELAVNICITLVTLSENFTKRNSL